MCRDAPGHLATLVTRASTGTLDATGALRGVAGCRQGAIVDDAIQFGVFFGQQTVGCVVVVEFLFVQGLGHLCPTVAKFDKCI